MKHPFSKCLLAAVACALAGPAAHAAMSVHRFQQAVARKIRLDPARGTLRPVDFSLLKGKVASEILAGPTSGLDSAFILYTRREAGAKRLGLYTLPVEETYLVLHGELAVQIGTEHFLAHRNTLVQIPPGVPHQAWNAGAGPEVDFDVISPAPTRRLVSMMKPARASTIANAASYVHVPPPLGRLKGGSGHAALNERMLADLASGSRRIHEDIGAVLPGSRSEPTHIHPFDQVFFVRSGTMTVQYGLAHYEVHANSLVVVPRGVVHSDQNGGSSEMRFIQLWIPQPMPGKPVGVHVIVTKWKARPRK